jgi:hypothetical protein
MEKKYRYTEKELGDVFEGKVIYTDTLDVVAYILEETKDLTTGQRRYNHVPHTYWDIHDPEKPPHEDVEYPPLPIYKADMDLFHSPGRYMIKVVNRHNKAKSYGSVTFHNEGKEYLAVWPEEKTLSTEDRANSFDVKIAALEKKHDNDMREIYRMINKLMETLEKLAAKIQQPDYSDLWNKIL